MTRVGTKVRCFDNTGVIAVNIFKKFGGGMVVNKASYADMVYVSVVGLNTKAKNLQEEKQRIRFRKGSIHKAVIIHMAERFKRYDSTSIWFKKDAVVLVDSKGMPLGRKIKTIIPKEVADIYPQIASVALRVI